MNFKLFSILLIISVYADAAKYDLMRHKIKQNTLEDSIREGSGDVAGEKLINADVNLLLEVLFVDDDDDLNDEKTTPELLTLETSSSDLWVVGPNCKSSFCKNKVKENGNKDVKPSTAENGLVRGTLGNKNITFNDSISGDDIYTIQNVDFTAADYVDRSVEKRMSYFATGALGLGPSNVLIQAIRPQNVIALTVDSSSASLYINEVPNEPYKAKRIRIGSMSPSSWKISLGYISTSTPPFKNWCYTGCVAEIDTTFSGISGPAKDINDLNAFIGADEDGSIDCYKSKLIAPFIFHIHGQRYRLDAKNVIVEDKDSDKYSGKCKSQFKVEYSNNGAWRLGLAFLQQFTTVFEYSDESSNNFVSFIQP